MCQTVKGCQLQDLAQVGSVCLSELLELHPFSHLILIWNSNLFQYTGFVLSEVDPLSGFSVKPSDFLLTCLKDSNSVCQTLFLHRSNYWLPALVFPRALSRKWHELTWIAKYCFHRVSGSKVLIISMLSTHLTFRVLNECSVCMMRYFLVSQRNTHRWFQAAERPLHPHSPVWKELPALLCVSLCCSRPSQSTRTPWHPCGDLCPAGWWVILWSKLLSYSEIKGITTTQV